MRIDGMKRCLRLKRKNPFDDLTPGARAEAQRRLNRMLARHPRCPRWLLPILYGQARRQARMTPEQRRTWGLRMQARHGGLAVQRVYRRQGRDTLTHARYVRQLKRQQREREVAEDDRRKQLGLPPPRRWKRLPLADRTDGRSGVCATLKWAL